MPNTVHTAGTTDTVDTAALIEDLYPALAALRKAGPVHRSSGTDGRPAWLVTRYDDVRQAFADPRLSLDKRHAAPGNYSGFSLPPALDTNLLNMDPPDHTRVRRLVVKAFTPGRVEKLREPVRRVAEELLDAIGADGTPICSPRTPGSCRSSSSAICSASRRRTAGTSAPGATP